MARARNIKPGLFTNEVLVDLPAFDRLLFIGLWCLADREGRLEDRVKRIKMELFPCDNYDIEVGLSNLAGAGFIRSSRSAILLNIKTPTALRKTATYQTLTVI